MSMFEPTQIAMISMGTLTFIKPAINKLRSAGLKSKVLQIPMVDAVGKSSYTKEIKAEIFSNVYNEFRAWHDDLFFYLCMDCLLYTSPSPRDKRQSRMPSSA